MPRCDNCGKLVFTVYVDDFDASYCKNCLDYAYIKEEKI